MNDHVEGTAAPKKASVADMKKGVLAGRRLFERIEEAFTDLVKVWGGGLSMGMMTKNEHDHLVNDTEALRSMTLSLHCRGTAIAQRNKADGALPRSGGVGVLGGPGR